jgi:oligopeptide/dipeptide ABC transporter ATP-binding protein
MSAPLLQITGLRKTFHTRHGVVNAIDGVNLEVAEGTTTALVGESGSGKTTLGRSVLRLTGVDAGSIVFDGRELTGLSDREMRPIRKDAQMVFQAQSASLNPRMTVGKVLEEPLLLAGERNRASRRTRVEEALRQVQLDTAYHDRYPSELSGGEQQRVGIARAIITEPRLVVLDEPTAALDAHVRQGIYVLLAELQERLGLTYLLISHDLSSVWGVADAVAVMHRGRIVEHGARGPVFLDSRHPYTVALMTAAPHIGARAAERHPRLVLHGDGDLGGEDLCRFAGRCPMVQDRCRTKRPPVGVAQDGHLVACWRSDEVPEELAEFRTAWHSVETATRNEEHA